VPALLDHLSSTDFEPEVLDAPEEGFVPLSKLGTTQTLEAQIKTTDWLKELGAVDDEEVITEAQQAEAREAFKGIITDPDHAKNNLVKITTPPAIKQIVGMLTAYEWEFVEEAKRLRSMAVAKIVQETDHPDARIRLKALEMLGKVTEVSLFTDKIEIKKADLSDDELNEKIRQKLIQLQKTVDAEAKAREDKNSDAVDVEITPSGEEQDGSE
jgi:hypothetical protein